MSATAKLSNYHQSPRKVRLLADLVRGKSALRAIAELKFLNKRASGPFAKLIESAVANAGVKGLDKKSLFVQAVTVDKGIVMKRMMPRAHGRGFPINKRTSHISVTVAEKSVFDAEVAEAPKKTKALVTPKAK